MHTIHKNFMNYHQNGIQISSKSNHLSMKGKNVTILINFEAISNDS